jgi:hypothetical protein
MKNELQQKLCKKNEKIVEYLPLAEHICHVAQIPDLNSTNYHIIILFVINCHEKASYRYHFHCTKILNNVSNEYNTCDLTHVSQSSEPYLSMKQRILKR